MKNKSSTIFILFALLIIIGVFLLYAPTLNDPFHFDDPKISTKNQDVQKGDFFKLAKYPRAVAAVSFGVNYGWTGLKTWSWHLVNIALFALMGVLLILVLAKISPPENSRHAFFMGLAALIFAAHPMATQAVAYISQRAEIFCGIFSLGALWAYMSSRRATKKKAWLFYGIAIIFTVLAVRGKEIGAVLPAVFVAAEIFLLKAPFSKIKRGICVGGTLAAVLFFVPLKIAKIAAGDPATLTKLGDNMPGFAISRAQYFFSGQEAVWKYLRLVLLPYGQAIDHQTKWSMGLYSPSTLLAFTALIAALVLVIFLWRRSPLVSFGLVWFWLFLAPVTTFFPLDDLVAEHRVLLPMVGLIFVLYGIVRELKKPLPWILLMCAVIITFSVATVYRVQVWGAEVSLWKDATIKAPFKARPWNNLGIGLVKKGQIEQAKMAFNKAIVIDPDYGEAQENLANCCVLTKDWNCAISGFSIKLKIKYDRKTAFTLLKVMALANRAGEIKEFLDSLPVKESKALEAMAQKDPLLMD